MDKRQQLRRRRLEQMQGFLLSEDLTHGLYGDAYADLASSVTGLVAIASDQDSARGQRSGFVNEVNELVRILREDHMFRIAGASKRLLKNIAGVEAARRVPRVRVRPAVLVAAALEMARVLRPYAAEFVKKGFERDFLKNLRAAALALRKASTGSAESSARLTRRTKEIRLSLSRGHAAGEEIHRMLRGRMRTDRSFRVRWLAARALPAKLGRPTDEEKAKKAAKEKREAGGEGTRIVDD